MIIPLLHGDRPEILTKWPCLIDSKDERPANIVNTGEILELGSPKIILLTQEFFVCELHFFRITIGYIYRVILKGGDIGGHGQGLLRWGWTHGKYDDLVQKRKIAVHTFDSSCCENVLDLSGFVYLIYRPKIRWAVHPGEGLNLAVG